MTNKSSITIIQTDLYILGSKQNIIMIDISHLKASRKGQKRAHTNCCNRFFMYALYISATYVSNKEQHLKVDLCHISIRNSSSCGKISCINILILIYYEIDFYDNWLKFSYDIKISYGFSKRISKTS